VKKIQLTGLILLLLLSACKKSNLEPINNTLFGKWTYTEYFYSTGGPGEWHSVTPANQTIEFQPDGSLVSSVSFLKTATKFEKIDSVTIKFQPAPTTRGYILMGYSIDTRKRELYLRPVDPICIEGCNNRFER
jgi:hypothetical protein